MDGPASIQHARYAAEESVLDTRRRCRVMKVAQAIRPRLGVRQPGCRGGGRGQTHRKRAQRLEGPRFGCQLWRLADPGY